MKIIGIDSSGNVASVAYVADGVLIAEYTINNRKTHSQTLLPMLDRIVRDAEIQLSDIDAIAVAAGPGSFTGLRIGAATVKGLGLALEKPVIPIPTCEGLAYNLSTGLLRMPKADPEAEASAFPGLVVPIMDARRGQVYTGIYRITRTASPGIPDKEMGPADPRVGLGTRGLRTTENPIMVVEDQMALSIEELLEKLAAYGEPVIFLGDGVPVFRTVIEETCKVPFTFAPPQSALQRAASVAALGEIYAAIQASGNREEDAGPDRSSQGKRKDSRNVRCMIHADDFTPIYLRKSQAEREHEAAAKARQTQDLQDVAAMEQMMFSDAWSLDSLTDSVRYPYNHILLISTEGDIRPLVSEEDVADSFVVGEEEQRTAGYLIYADPSDEAELHRIAVLPEYRRHGLARKLMAELLLRTGHVPAGEQKNPDVKPIFLEVRAGNTAAIALYLANHFREIDRRKNYYHEPDEDAVVMERVERVGTVLGVPEPSPLDQHPPNGGN